MRLLVFSLLLIVSITAFSQKDFQGRAIYQSKTTVDLANWGNGELPEQRKKQIMERMKSMLEKTYILDFNKTTSIYKEEEKLETPGQRGFRFGGFTGSGVRYKNISTSKMLASNEFFGKKFLINEELTMPKWEMTAETKQIGKYTCYKATMMKKTDEFDWSNMRRRRNDNKAKDTANIKKVSDDIELPKEVLVTAWYTPQIPVSNGPGAYWGLPGLILEVSAGRTTILCTEVTLNPTEKEIIKAPTKGKQVTRKEYNAIVKKKMEEMREMFRNRRGGNRLRG